jgi:aryl-alcohol dehydrogenase-like predicted oxidoreductase
LNYRKLGRSGLSVSELCLGAWMNFGDRIDDEQTAKILDTAVEEGINFFDTANIYGKGKAEEVMGRWMKRKDRRRFIIATKCGIRMWDGPNGEGAGRSHILEACDNSLRRLQSDYIDLYQIHVHDTKTPPEETLRAMNDLMRAGKIRHFGWSNHNAAAVRERARASETIQVNKAVSLQNPYSMLDRAVEKEDIPCCVEEGIGLIPFCPLSQGMLTEKYLDGTIPEDSRGAGKEWFGDRVTQVLPVLKKLAKFAHERDITLSQLALAWLLHQPAMTAPIIGASRPEHIKENVKAVNVKLSEDDLKKLAKILKDVPAEKQSV